MKISKSLKLALNILFHSKLRTWLTILGIVIGIAAVVSIVSISEGAKANLEERLGAFGADLLTISPGVSRAFGPGEFRGDGQGEESSTISKNLTSKDVKIIENLANVKYVMGQVSGRADVTYLSKTAAITIQGVDETVWKDITTEKIESGRLLSRGDTYSTVLGANTASSIFNNIPVGGRISIEGKSFRVVGILAEGRGVYIPLETARDVLEDSSGDNLDSISIKIEDTKLSNETVNLIIKKLMISRGIVSESKKDFTVSNPVTMQATMQSTMDTMALFLGAIAAISLLVGAIGIANTMFTSVLEKTREIGVMKAIGARDKDILTIFLLNSAIIGLVGGLGGVILGFFSSTAISSIGGIQTSSVGGGRGGFMNFFSSSVVTPELVIGALLFSVAIGMIAGAIPAWRASRLNPVDALRYE